MISLVGKMWEFWSKHYLEGRRESYATRMRMLQWPPLDVSTGRGKVCLGGGAHVDRQTLLKTLPSLAAGKNEVHKMFFLGAMYPDLAQRFFR